MPLLLVGHIFIVLIGNIFGCPVVPFTFGGEIWGYIYVNSCSAGLCDLQSARNGVSVAIFHEVGASLMKRERHASLNALAAHIEHPFVATFARIHPRFAAHRHLLDAVIEPLLKVHRLEHRCHNYRFVLDGQTLEDGQAEISHSLIFYRATHYHIAVAVAPIGRHTFGKAMNALGEEVEHAVATQAHHKPTLTAPLVGSIEQKIAGKASENYAARWDLVGTVAAALHGQSESPSFARHIAAHVAAILRVLPIHIAVAAPGANLSAAVPRIPTYVCRIEFLHVGKVTKKRRKFGIIC